MQSSNNSKRGRGAPKGNSNARRHGFYARKLAHSAPEAVIAGDGAHVAGSPPDEAGFSLPASASLLVSGARVAVAPALGVRAVPAEHGDLGPAAGVPGAGGSGPGADGGSKPGAGHDVAGPGAAAVTPG